MTDEQLFGLANAVPLAGWIALLLAPLARARFVAIARVVAVGVAAALAGSGGPMPDLTTLSGLARAFGCVRCREHQRDDLGKSWIEDDHLRNYPSAARHVSSIGRLVAPGVRAGM